MKIGPGLAVEIEYELRVKGGDVVESSARTGPLRYVHGDGKMLAGLESRLTGLGPGEERRGDIPAPEAFGTEESAPTAVMPRSAFPKDAKLEPGARFQGKDPASGGPVQLKIVSVDGAGSAATAKVKLLHPLLGRDLEFRVKVLSVRDPRIAAVPPPPPGVVELDLQPDEDPNT
jgi:FKBP-type peptidyl-prolyl cis-trans isomerase SlyD